MTTPLATNAFTDILEGRRSIRKYDADVAIPRSEMLEMLDEAAKAPSSVNMQPWRFLIVESKEGRATLKPLIRFNTRQNATSSAMQFMLVARSHGYDTNPIGGFEEDRIAAAFGLDESRYVPVMILSIGKADSTGHESYRLPAEDLSWWR